MAGLSLHFYIMQGEDFEACARYLLQQLDQERNKNKALEQELQVEKIKNEELRFNISKEIKSHQEDLNYAFALEIDYRELKEEIEHLKWKYNIPDKEE